jgi:hypothetical protein
MAQAQDPGLPDSVILYCDSVVPYNPGNWNYVNISVFCNTDDSILFINMPLKWSGNIAEIYPVHIAWHNTFYQWWNTNYSPPDSGSNHFSIFASGEQSVPLFTGYNRELEALIRFAIEPSALPQVIVIDTATDSINGRIEFANIDVTFRPKFKGARFQYGVPGQAIEGYNGRPGEFILKGCHPNPFNSSIMIEFDLPEHCRCKLFIYDILGREIAYLVDGELKAGQYSVGWNGKDKSGGNVSSGIYFATLIANNRVQAKRITLIR